MRRLPPSASLAVIALAVAASRFVAFSRTLWDWDEALFCFGLHDYDVAAHHPHPPGFPLFIALARIIRVVIRHDFRALQAVAMLGAFLAFPALYFLARTLEMPRVTAVVAALLFSFLPNVWYFGGTAFSDVPAVVVVIAAAALLLRGGDDRRSYLLGCLLLGVSIAFRPQNALLGAWPWLAGSWPRFRKRKFDPLLGGVIAAAVVAASYGGAALATGSWTAYRDAVSAHREYVMKVDSYRNPGRPPVKELFHDFAIDPYHAGRVSTIVAVFAALGILRMRRGTRHALATFGPFFLFAWFMLDVTSLSRLAIGYMPLLALLAGEGMRTVAEVVVAVVRRPLSVVRSPHPDNGQRTTDNNRQPSTVNWQLFLQIFFLTGIFARLVPWTASALREVRRHDAPTWAAPMWIRAHLDPATTTVYVHGSMGPFAEYLLAEYRQQPVGDDFRIDQISNARDAWLLTAGASAAENAVNFRRPHGRLWNINHHGYFETSVQPLSNRARFLEGWYGEESTGTEVWRWMAGRSVTLLPAIDGNGEVSLRFYVPLDGLPHPPRVTISFNGAEVETLTPASSEIMRRYTLPSRLGKPNELVVTTDGVVNPARAGRGGDTRDLGLQLRSFSWKALPR